MPLQRIGCAERGARAVPLPVRVAARSPLKGRLAKADPEKRDLVRTRMQRVTSRGEIVADANAIVVQCPGCSARFSLAKDRVPKKGARVRCSRCQHRFYVSPDGEVREAAPARKTSGTATQPGVRKSPSTGERKRSESENRPSAPPSVAPEVEASAPSDEEPTGGPKSPWSMRAGPDPREDTSLDNPEFLFEGSSTAATTPRGGVDLGDSIAGFDPSQFLSGATEGEAEAAPEEVQSEVEPGFAISDGDTSSEVETQDSVPRARASAERRALEHDEQIPDIRAQKDELAAQRALAALDAAEDDEPPSAPSQAIESEIARQAPRASMQTSIAEEPSDAGLVEGESPFELGSSHVPMESPSPRASSAASPLESFADLEESGTTGFGSATAAVPARTENARTETASPSQKRGVRVSSSDAYDEGGADAGSPARRQRDEALGRLLALAVGLLLLVGVVRASYLGSVQIAPRAELAGDLDSIVDVSIRHLADARGERLTVVRGRFEGPSTPVGAVLLDRGDRRLGDVIEAQPVRLTDEQLASLRLAGEMHLAGSLLDRPAGSTARESQAPAQRDLASVEPAGRGSDASGFTVLIPNPDPRARRVALVPTTR